MPSEPGALCLYVVLYNEWAVFVAGHVQRLPPPPLVRQAAAARAVRARVRLERARWDATYIQPYM